MKKYKVTYFYSTHVTVEVDAYDEGDAIQNGKEELFNDEWYMKTIYKNALFRNLNEEDTPPEVKEIE